MSAAFVNIFPLREGSYELVNDSRSEALGLRLGIEEKLIEFYREDTGEKLLIPEELWAALQAEREARIETQEIAEAERQRADILDLWQKSVRSCALAP